MRSRVFTVLQSAVLFLVFTSQAPAAPSDTLAGKVDAVITPGYFHGVPYEQAKALGREAIPILRSRLHDPEFQEHLPSICSAIGFIGAPEGFPILRDFVWDPGVVRDSVLGSPRACTAELVAQSVIGLIAKNSDDALKYLQQSTNPACWDTLPWYCSDRGNTRMELVEMSIIGLTYSERPEARAFLMGLSQSGKTENIRLEAGRGVIRFDEISKVGFAEYKRRAQKY